MKIRKFSKKSLVAVSTTMILVLVSTVWLLGFGLAKHITIVDSDKEIKVTTMAKTVEEVLKDHEISLYGEDLVAPPLDSEIENNTQIIITRSKGVTIDDEGNITNFRSRCKTVGEVLDEAALVLGEYDIVSHDVDAPVTDGISISIQRAKRVTVTVDGQTHERYTTKPTVADFLNDVCIYLEQYDEITPYLETPITDGLDIVISRVTVENETVEEKVARNVIKKQSADYANGKVVVTQEGSDGISKNTYKVIKRNGSIVSRTLLESTVIKKPVDKIVVTGTKKQATAAKTTAASKTQTQTSKVTASRGGLSYRKVIQCTATAYSGGGRTATGRAAAPGVVAVDPSVIPLNSKLYIESTDDGKTWTYGYAIAGDTGGAIKGNKIDLYFSSNSECYSFGRRQCNVYILN